MKFRALSREECEKFILKAKQEMLELSIIEIFRDTKDYKGGFGFRGILSLECGNLKIRNECFYSSSTALKEFAESIEKVYTSLQGEVIYNPSYEDNLYITIKLNNCCKKKQRTNRTLARTIYVRSLNKIVVFL